MVKTYSILQKLRFRELKQNLKNYLSVILIAMLSIALFTGLSSNQHKLADEMNEIYEKSNIGSYFVQTNGYSDSSEFDADQSYLKSLTTTSTITTRLYTSVNYKESSCYLIAYDNKELSHEAEITSGDDGILVSKSLADDFSLSAGNTIDITISYDVSNYYSYLEVKDENNDFLKNNEIKVSLKIDGIMLHAEAIDKVGLGGLIYLSMDTFKKCLKNSILSNYDIIEPYKTMLTAKNVTLESYIDNLNIYNQFVIKSSDDLKLTIDQYFQRKKNNNLLLTMTTSTLPTNSGIEADVIQAKQLLYVFPVVFYIVGVLVIITSLSQLINKDKKVIGCMSSLGLTKWQIILHYTSFAFLIVFIGGIIGAIIGPLLIPFVMSQKYKILYDLPSISVNFFSVETFLCFIILFLIALVASICVSYKIASVYPSKIFRDDNSNKNKGSMLKKNRFKHISLPIKMSLRNLKNNLSRSIMVIIGVMGCSALLVCGFGIDNTLDYGINNDTIEKAPYDCYGTISDVSKVDEIKSLTSVKDLELYLSTNTTLLTNSKQIDSTLYIYEHGNIVNIAYSDTGATITTKVANKLNLSVGDTLTFYYNNTYYEVKVDRIEEMFYYHGIMISNKYFESLNGTYTPNYFYATTNTNEEELKEELDSLDFIDVKMTMDEFNEKIDNVLSGIRIITLTVKVFAIILAIVVIYNLALLNFKERIRDIATLKVLGFGQREVATTLLVETSILTVIGSALGMLLGLPLLKLLLGINEVDAIEYLYHINILSYLYALILTVIVSVIINFFITFYTNKIEMVESLKSLE